MSCQRIACCLVTLASTAALHAQRTWIVDWNNGPGTDFTTIQPAVDAATAEDTILVRGTGPTTPQGLRGYQAPTIDGKALTILGEGSQTTGIRGAFVIRNTRASDIVILASFVRGSWLDILPVMEITNCQGPVLLRDLTNEGGPWRITDAAMVIASHCTIRQYSGFHVLRSSLMLDDTTTNYDTVMPYAVSPPIHAVRSKVWITNTTLRGQSCAVAQGYDPAMYTEDSDLWIGPGTTLIGGVNCFGVQPAILDGWQGSNDCLTVVTIPGSRMHIDPGVQVLGSYLVGCQTITFAPVTSTWATRANNTLVVNQRCAPASITVLGIGPFELTPVAPLPALLAIDLDQSILCLSVAPPSGSFQLQFAVPPGLPLGFKIGLQAGAINPQGVLSLSNATVFGIW